MNPMQTDIAIIGGEFGACVPPRWRLPLSNT